VSALLAAAVVVVALAAYAVTGGADFGGGVWDLLASGPRKEDQRAAISGAIAPIWEANHVWLILVVVLLFVAFPPVFSALSIVLHIPLSLMLVGVVLRGAAFVFRAYDPEGGQGWGRVFASASTFTPVALGICLGAAFVGFEVEGTDFVSPWLAPFPVLLGLFVLALFAFLAAVYLGARTEGALQEDFRLRALGSGAISGLLAFGCLALAPHQLASLSLGFHVLTGLCALGALVALWRRVWRLARPLAVAQVLLVVAGWAWAQYPMALAPGWTIADAAAPEGVLNAMLVALAAGSALLIPAFIWLYRVFAR
jgi:cytochrome bd ubiquinol oxidase subunit II